jgi:hypothetical protein
LRAAFERLLNLSSGWTEEDEMIQQKLPYRQASTILPDIPDEPGADDLNDVSSIPFGRRILVHCRRKELRPRSTVVRTAISWLRIDL